MPSNTKRIVLPFVALTILVFIAYLISSSKPAATTGKMSKVPRLAVNIQKIEARDFDIEIQSFGTIQAKTSTELFPLVSGRVNQVASSFESGGFFNKGDRLLQIDPVDYQIEVQIAQGQVAAAELALEEERARHEQAKRDWQKNKKPELATDLALRLPQLKAASAEVETAKARLKLAELNHSRTSVTAPYNGRVLETFVNIGSVVGASSKLATIYSSGSVEVRLPIANKDLPFLTLPDESFAAESISPIIIENQLYKPQQDWKGKLLRTEAAVDATSQQLYVVASVEEPFESVDGQRNPLKIGQYVSAIVSGRSLSNVIVIDSQYIYQGTYVYVVVGDLLYRRDIQILWQNADKSIVSSGLDEGDMLVITPLGQVISGTRVEIKYDDNHHALLEAEQKPSNGQEASL